MRIALFYCVNLLESLLRIFLSFSSANHKLNIGLFVQSIGRYPYINEYIFLTLSFTCCSAEVAVHHLT